jgi:cell division protein ZapA (FtsZ GTPase activity inhibitor)
MGKSQSDNKSVEARVVTVEIAGQRYPIRSSLDAALVAELAAYIDRKMALAADAAPASDSLGLAILVALNVADELFRARQQLAASDHHLADRALRLERLVDDALAQIPDLQALTLDPPLTAR